MSKEIILRYIYIFQIDKLNLSSSPFPFTADMRLLSYYSNVNGMI